jgi:hypothetical protein
MKKVCFVLSLLMQTGCQWVVTHPKEDAVIVEAVEEAALKLYEYETRTLSPGMPPHKILGPTGPKGP